MAHPKLLLDRKIRRRVLIAIALLLFAGIVGIKIWRHLKGHKIQIFLAQINCLSSVKDIEYVDGSKDPFQSLDLYLPKKPRAVPTPLIIWIHGGAWISGDKNHPPAQIMLDRGFAVASLNYRLSNKQAHPAQIFDCKAAVRYLRAHAAEYKLDPERFGLWGHSAGGHLVALLGTSCDVKDLEGSLGCNNVSSRVQAVADWAGPTDLTTVAKQAPPNCKINFNSPGNPVAVLMGLDQTPQGYLSASPVKYVRKDNPPFLILHAEDDDVVPVQQARELCALLKKNSVPLVCHISPNGGHGLFRQEFIDETMAFFEKYLASESAPNAVTAP